VAAHPKNESPEDFRHRGLLFELFAGRLQVFDAS
jgi:hypothetical protein